MSQQFMLLESNSELGLKDGIYQDLREPFRDSSIPQHVSDAVIAVFDQANDKSLLSLDIKTLSNSHELKEALAIRQFSFLQSIDLSQVNTALDLSEDFGGISHYIADNVGQVESVKIDSGLAKISKIRCANKHNVCHISADLDALVYPSNHYDLIIIGRLEALHLEPTRLATLLTNLQMALTDNGTLLMVTPNSERLNKWFDQTTSINGQAWNSEPPFADLYKAKKESDPVTQISRKQIRDTLLRCNFASVDIHASFSDGDNLKALFSENYLTAAVNGVNHFHQLDTIKNSNINEFLLFKRLVEEKQNLVDYASHFVVLAGASSSSIREVYDNDFTHFASTDDKPQWQVNTSRKRSAHDVKKHLTYPQQKNSSTLINESLERVPFHKGRLLAADWIQAIFDKDHRGFENLIQEFSDWLHSAEYSPFIEKGLFDVNVSTIILSERNGLRNYHLIGNQRTLSKKHIDTLSADFLLFRTLYWFAQKNRSLVTTYAIQNDIHSLGLFIIEHMDNVFQKEDLLEFAKLEDKIQAELVNDANIGSVEQNLEEPFYLPDSSQLIYKTIRRTKDTKETLLNTISAQNTSLLRQSFRLKQLRIDSNYQNQRITHLLEQRTELVEKLKSQTLGDDDLESKLRAEIDQLHERLDAQHRRNDELHGYLLMRPTTRAKRVARRTVNRLTGKAAIEQSPEPEAVVAESEQPPLPTGELIGQNTEDYQLWISENALSEADIKAAKVDIETMKIKPVFSILVPIYNTDPEYLLPMIESVQNQIYPHWQLCLVDDCSPKSYLKRILEHEALQDERISVQLNDVNQGISVTTNDALAMAVGDYIALLDHDDEISIDALYENAKVINSTPDVGLIYSDEDKIDMQGQRLEAYFKPDYSPDLLHTNNYICHFTVIKKSIAQELGGFREGLDGSQDHDIIIRSAVAAKRVVHIPKVLYHWRKIPGSTAVEYDSKSYAWEAGRKAVEDQLSKDETGVRVEFGTLKGTYRVFREIKGKPLVSIIIPFKDKPELLDSCLNSILNRSSYENFEIIGISNNSDQELTFERMRHYTEFDDRIRFVEKNIPFNFSAICNFGVAQANGEYIVLLNNDIEIISPDWIERLLEHAQGDEIGAVGGKLLFPDGRIQHAGVVAGMVGAAGHPHKFFPENHIGYHGRLHMVYNVSAVTGAMLMINAAKYKEVGGLDEENLAIAYNDIDLCLKLLDKGYRNVFTPHSKATHHESISRGYEDTDEKMQRLLKEQKHFLSRWDDFLKAGDPYYNPNLSLKNERFSLKFKD